MKSFIVYSEYLQVFLTSVYDNWVKIYIREMKLLEIFIRRVKTTKNPKNNNSVYTMYSTIVIILVC